MSTCTTRTKAFTDHGISDLDDLVSRTFYALVTSDHATPEVSSEFAEHVVTGVGALEEELRADGREYATNTYRYEETARGDAMHAAGSIKVSIDLEGEILCCHIIGPEESTLIQEVVVAMRAGSGTVQDIRESVQIHPALPAVVQRAFTGRFSRGGAEQHHQH